MGSQEDISDFGQGCAVPGSGLSSQSDHTLTHSLGAGIIIFISAAEWGSKSKALFQMANKGYRQNVDRCLFLKL